MKSLAGLPSHQLPLHPAPTHPLTEKQGMMGRVQLKGADNQAAVQRQRRRTPDATNPDECQSPKPPLPTQKDDSGSHDFQTETERDDTPDSTAAASGGGGGGGGGDSTGPLKAGGSQRRTMRRKPIYRLLLQCNTGT